MTLTAVENQIKVCNERIKKLEEAGLDKCTLLSDFRVLISVVTTFKAQVDRAITAIKAGQPEVALTELDNAVRIA